MYFKVFGIKPFKVHLKSSNDLFGDFTNIIIGSQGYFQNLLKIISKQFFHKKYYCMNTTPRDQACIFHI